MDRLRHETSIHPFVFRAAAGCRPSTGVPTSLPPGSAPHRGPELRADLAFELGLLVAAGPACGGGGAVFDVVPELVEGDDAFSVAARGAVGGAFECLDGVIGEGGVPVVFLPLGDDDRELVAGGGGDGDAAFAGELGVEGGDVEQGLAAAQLGGGGGVAGVDEGDQPGGLDVA